MNDSHNIKNPGHNVTRDSRTTIGMLLRNITDIASHTIWLGVIDAIRELDVNLISFAGEGIRSPVGFEAQGNILYDLAKSEHLNGIIIGSAGLDWAIGPREMERFCRRYHPLPLASVETPLEGIPGVLVDNYQGMHEVVAHLIAVHGYRRIAFIRGAQGHEGAQERYRAYTETLSKYGLSFDPSLVTPPLKSWDSEEIIARINVWLDTSNTEIDAIVGASDHIAFIVIRLLQKRGIRVPDGVAVVGFDDREDAGAFTPPLTTAHPSFYELGRRAAETLIARIAGEDVPDRVIVPAKMVVRQSCGCIDSMVIQAKAGPFVTMGESCKKAMPAKRTTILAEMVQALGSSKEVTQWVAQVLDAFIAELEGDSQNAFLSILDDVLRRMDTESADVEAWQNALSIVRRQILPYCDEALLRERVEDLMQQARVLIGRTALRIQQYQTVRMAQRARIFREIGSRLISTFDVGELMDVLVEELPRLNIPGCYLALYEHPEPYTYPQPAPEWSRLVLAYHEQEHVALNPETQRFASRQLLPEGMLPRSRQYAMIVEPLYFQEHQIGFVLFEIGPREGGAYDFLRGEFSSALQEVMLMRQVRQHAAEIARHRDHLEDLVKERTSEISQINANLHQEIVERKHVEQALQLNERQYRLLAENVKDGILIIQDEKLVFANAAFAAMAGQTIDQLYESDLSALFPASAKRFAHDVLEHTLEPWQVELISSDGRMIWAEIEQSAIMWNNQPAFLLTVRDITQNKLREMRLEEERARLHQENLTFKSASTERYRFGQLVGKSAAMQRVYEMIISAAVSDVNVLIVGESGTGKELIARSIHQVSPRKEQAFVPVNCASIPETLFEREFFGHRKGTFTGADRDKPGFFDRAHQGILFLDEVTELSSGAQAKLLRVLQDGEYIPLGSTAPQKADVVVVAATNKNCQTEIEAGRLRQDFFYRICVIKVKVPPLRERKEDLPFLIEHLLTQYRQKRKRLSGETRRVLSVDQTALPADLMHALSQYHWPGNVRELQNVLQHYLATEDLASTLSLVGVSASQMASLGSGITAMPPDESTLPEAIEILERKMIAATLSKTRNNRRKTARILGITPRTLYAKLAKYGLRESG